MKTYYTTTTSEKTPLFKELRKTRTLKSIAEEYGITPERVRQVTIGVKKVDWDKTIQRGYAQKAKKFDEKKLLSEAKRLSPQNRKRQNVLKRQVIIKLLRDKYHYSFLKLAKVCKRDHTSIISLYYKK